MEDLKRMAIFSAVVDAKSFTSAAKRMGIAKSAVSQHIKLLEKHLGVRLLNRTTRSLSLTESGERYYQSCMRIISEVEDATQEIRQLQSRAVGTLKLSSTVAFGVKHLIPILSQFHQQHPELKVDLLLDDDVLDIVEQGVDLSIRIGWLPETSLVARKLFSSPRIVVATPEYLEKRGTPKKPGDLSQHNWIVVSLMPTPLHHTFKRGRQHQKIQMSSTTRTNSIDASLAFVRNGDGITAVSAYLIEDDLEEGRLVPLLQDYEIEEVGIYAVYPDRHYVPTKVRLFIDVLKEYCGRWDNRDTNVSCS